MVSANCTMRWRNCVRTPLLSEPLSILICTRSIAPCSVALSPCHHAASVSTMQSRSEEHTSELQSRGHLVCRLLLEKKKKKKKTLKMYRLNTFKHPWSRNWD